MLVIMQETLGPATEAVLLASRAMVGIAARCMPQATEVTLPQWRALVLLETRGQLNMHSLAQLLSVDPSTCTRLCDRLEKKGLIERGWAYGNRREVWLTLTAMGSSLVQEANEKRLAEIRSVLGKLSGTQRQRLAEALGPFVQATGEHQELAWSLGWAN